MDILTSEVALFLFAAWFTFFGGAVGSFLNVVVYRVPAGLNIAWPSSHCPKCKHPIRAFDNVPVLAWLWLRGRCRDCGLPISIRYPLVEAVAAGLFLLLLVVEVFHGGTNLPMRTPPAAGLPAEYPMIQALGICLLHAALLSTFMASALISLDGHRPPWRLFAPLLAVGYLTPILWPWLHPQPAGRDEPDAWAGLIDGSVGLAVGYGLGRAVQWLGRHIPGFGRPGFSRPAYQICGETALIGVVLGWQAAAVLVPSAMALEELTRLAAFRWRRLGRVTAAFWLVPLALIWILNWAWIAAAFPVR